jgi:uncharacterized protein (DUF1800 family)
MRRDPRGWLSSQLQASQGPTGLESIGPLTYALHRANKRDQKSARKLAKETYDAEANAREAYAATTRHPFQERLVRFWSNHFCVSITQVRCVGLVGNFERQVIRPNLGGHFVDLVLASAHHPAMLLYLDQTRSVGPNSRVGRKRGKGLNENYARELMELHTLGVNGGYTQQDVQALAAILTGWGLDPGQGRRDPFEFDSRRHEPGDHTLLGQRLPEGGHDQGLQALELLAAHPSTALFIATKLVRHFVSDKPHPQDVAHIARTFTQTEGHLPSVHEALIHLERAWQPGAPKLRTPAELVTAIARGIGYNGQGEELLQGRRALGQMPWAAPSPQGWSDRASAWTGPDSIVARVDLAKRFAERAELDVDPVALGERLLGARFPAQDRKLLAGMSPLQGVAVLLASPSFQWRAQ